ncbi:MAG: hypothetical protein HY553_01785 [Elusimicrobia bacterium]|nr:hypothetical protein [Elusimicrobiota bacterium]
MVCPKCGEKAAYEAQEACTSCRLVFSTWKPGGGATATEAPVAAKPLPVPEPSAPWVDWRLVAGLVAVLAAAFALRGLGAAKLFVYLSPGAPGGRVKNPCNIEGEVVDIYRLTPVEGARIVFDPKFASVTDADGRFSVRVKAEQAYVPIFTHSAYHEAHIDGFSRDWREATEGQRVHAVRAAEARAAETDPRVPRAAQYKCRRSESRVYNFALIPRELTDEERARFAAIP